MTWIDVANDAVKIGLGALVGAAASMITLWMSQNHEKKMGLIERKEEILMKIADEFEESTAIGAKFARTLPLVLLKPDQGRSVFLADALTQLIPAFTMVGRAKTRATLIGLPDLAGAIDEYEIALGRYKRNFDPDNEIDKEVDRSLVAQLNASAQTVRTELANAYGRLHK